MKGRAGWLIAVIAVLAGLFWALRSGRREAIRRATYDATRWFEARERATFGIDGAPVATDLQRWPAPDPMPWPKESFGIVPGKSHALIGFSRAGGTLYAFRSQVRPARCAISEDSKPWDCVSLPNGQLVRTTPELFQQIPILAMLRQRAERAPAKPRPSPGQK